MTSNALSLLDIDNIYVINLNKNKINYDRTIEYLKLHNIINYKIIDAVNTVNNNYIYDNFYNYLIKNMDKTFVKHNFSKGALGCLLSHIKCIEDAIENNFSKIIILEDDFIPHNNLFNEFKKICYIYLIIGILYILEKNKV